MKAIRFRFAAEKARAAIEYILWIVAPQTLDLHTALKTFYFADKAHLNRFGRPIVGATYRAMRYGPVPLEIYEMLKGEPQWLAEAGVERFSWELLGTRLRATANGEPDLSTLSETDLDELRKAFDTARGMTFDERTAATHGPDWQAANLGVMRYEDMIQDGPVKEELIADLREVASSMRL